MKELKILYLEDSEQDAELTGRFLRNAGIPFSFELVDNKEEYEQALGKGKPDVVLSDHSMFQFNSIEALKIFKTFNFNIPFILVTGTVSEEFAVNILSEGADDYLLKDNLTRLPNAILSALEKFKIEDERQRYLKNIIASEALFKQAEQMAHFGSWDVDLISGSTKWSDEVFRIYGYNPGEIEPGFNEYIKHIHPTDVDHFKKLFNSSVADASACQCEYRIIDKSGRIRHINSKMVIERDENNTAVRLVGFNHDITERKEAQLKIIEGNNAVSILEKELAAQKLNQQKIITEVTIQAQEKERNELGKELHDNINQILTTVKMYLSVYLENPQTEPGLIRTSHDYLNEAIDEIRKLSKTLVSPSLGEIGLKEALHDLKDQIEIISDLHIDLSYELSDNKVDDNKRLMLYRVVQEQLNNILKHAKARSVKIVLMNCLDSVSLSISDDGIGFDPEIKSKGIGLKNMLSRVQFYSGKFDIEAAPGKGCHLKINIPL